MNLIIRILSLLFLSCVCYFLVYEFDVHSRWAVLFHLIQHDRYINLYICTFTLLPWLYRGKIKFQLLAVLLAKILWKEILLATEWQMWDALSFTNEAIKLLKGYAKQFTKPVFVSNARGCFATTRTICQEKYQYGSNLSQKITRNGCVYSMSSCNALTLKLWEESSCGGLVHISL